MAAFKQLLSERGLLSLLQDKIEPYLECSKRLYKELVSVQRANGEGALEVSSTVFRIKVIHTEAQQEGGELGACWLIVQFDFSHLCSSEFSSVCLHLARRRSPVAVPKEGQPTQFFLLPDH